MSDVSVWLVTTDSYGTYEVHAVALTQDAAQQYADAYNAAFENSYRDGVGVEEVELFTVGDPLPRRITYWNASLAGEWSTTHITNGFGEEPRVGDFPRGPIANFYPTREAARAAVDNYESENGE